MKKLTSPVATCQRSTGDIREEANKVSEYPLMFVTSIHDFYQYFSKLAIKCMEDTLPKEQAEFSAQRSEMLNLSQIGAQGNYAYMASQINMAQLVKSTKCE